VDSRHRDASSVLGEARVPDVHDKAVHDGGFVFGRARQYARILAAATP
jgi:hypothetical protein